jgi:glycosyltransferase involved in cell wall biosynthesis
MLSVLIPVKDEHDNVVPLCRQLRDTLDSHGAAAGWLDYEILFVDDGSSDGTFKVLKELAEADHRVKVVRLKRNYGQTAALSAGIDHARGEIIVTMDGDLQNDPRDIPDLVAKLDEGYDVVLGERLLRQDHFWIRKVPSWCGNWLIRKVTGLPFRDFGCTMRAMRREVADALPLYGEMHRFIPALANNCGARLTQIPVRHHPRRAGRTKYNLSRTVRVLLDLMTVQFLSRFVTRPMHLFGLLGLVAMLLGFLSLSAAMIGKYSLGLDLAGNPLLVVGVMLELAGIQLLSTGLLGELLARTYFESQGQTPYIVGERRNIGEGVAPPRTESKPDYRVTVAN